MSYWADINSDEIQDEQLRRQVKSLQKLGTAVLEENDLALVRTNNSLDRNFFFLIFTFVSIQLPLTRCQPHTTRL